MEIRAYVKACVDSGDFDPEWVKWALRKADWYDPRINFEDQILGRRS